ncbi:MAG: stalk domain-containing protein [Syntrophomonadaceae bacterium]|nr:stalk domain-containing protein [Syntrophomonadaceae bacterium]MDH7498074.1 stalk domain-containing protein [Syntrophomonadaceae bacterium]
MGKKHPALMLVLVLLMLFPASAPATAAPSVQIEGRPMYFDGAPVIENGRVLVPMRAIFEGLGASVSWDAATRTVTAVRLATEIKLSVGQWYALKNGAVLPLDVPARIIAGRTMVPIRFVSEALGAQVSWDAATQSVSIVPRKFTTITIYENDRLVAEYTGELDGNIPQGEGSITYGDGTTYVGWFVAGNREGRGTMNRADGAVLSGTWRNNTLVDGTVTVTLPGGTRLVRTYKGGVPSGPLTLLFPDGRSYTGELRDNMANGWGVLTYPNGKKIEGVFTNGNLTGQGTMTLPDGTRYEGQFTNSVPDGIGTIYYPDGSRYEGQVSGNGANGVGTLFLPNGTTRSGTWKDGRLVTPA